MILKLKTSHFLEEKNNLKSDQILDSKQNLDVVTNINYISSSNIQNNKPTTVNLPLNLKNINDFNSIFKTNIKHQNIKKNIFKNLYNDLEVEDSNKIQFSNLNYFDYLFYVISSFFNCYNKKEKKTYFKNKSLRIDQLLDFPTLIQYMTEQYSVFFYD